MKIKLDEGAIMPTRAHKTDAGLDLYSPEQVYIESHGSAVIDTGVHIELPPGSVGMIKSKSGLNVWHGLVSEGVIDEGYTGSIMIKLYNHSVEGYEVARGDKISQLIVLPVIIPSLQETDKLDETERGDDGLGSTGR